VIALFCRLYLNLFIDFWYTSLGIKVEDDPSQSADISPVVRVLCIVEVCVQQLQDMWKGSFDITDFTL
jgi:hypothetical protein